MAVEIEEQQCPTERITALVKLSAQLAKTSKVIVLRRKQLARLFHILIGTQFDDIIEANEIAVDIRPGYNEKNRCSGTPILRPQRAR